VPDQSPITITLSSADLERELASLPDVSELPPEVIERLIHIFDGGFELSRVEDSFALGTRELRLGIKIPEKLRELVAAVRASKLNQAIRI
jgi:hypothetical protein